MVDSLREQQLNESLELFFFAYREFTAYPDGVLAGKGLQRVHHRVLYFVGRCPGITVGELLKTLGVSKQALNAPLRRLTQLGLVESSAGEHDRRIRQLQLSATGQRLEHELSSSQRERMSAVFAQVGPEREAAWREIMTLVAG